MDLDSVATPEASAYRPAEANTALPPAWADGVNTTSPVTGDAAAPDAIESTVDALAPYVRVIADTPADSVTVCRS